MKGKTKNSAKDKKEIAKKCVLEDKHRMRQKEEGPSLTI